MSSTKTAEDKACDDDEVVSAATVLKDPYSADNDNGNNKLDDNNDELVSYEEKDEPTGIDTNNNVPDKQKKSQDSVSNNKAGDKNDDDDDNNNNADDASMSSSSFSSSTTLPTAADDDVLTTEQANEKLVLATQQKEQGNAYFKEGDLAQAARYYRRGVHTLKPLHVLPCNTNNNNNNVTTLTSAAAQHSRNKDPQIKALFVALQTNLSTVLFKQGKYNHSVQCATLALSMMDADGDETTTTTTTGAASSVKVLYRRAVAQRKLGNLDQAKADLKQALQHDNTNTTCKKELASIQKELERCKEAQKKALAKAFSNKSGSFLYDDKEAAEQKRLEKERQAEIQAQALYKQRKQQWEDECVKRMANNESAISFEEWEKEVKEKEETRRKQEEKKRKEEERKRRELAKQQRKLANDSNDDSDSDDDEEQLTKEELAMMRGYKKTSDGRTTSYFTRELSEQEKQQIGDIAPKRLDRHGNNNNNVSTTAPATISSPSSGNAPQQLKSSMKNEGASKWNVAGTWEERDTTAWCSAQLRKRLEETSVTANKVDVDIVSVDELTGDASFAIAGGKKRYIFDFHVQLKYEIKDPDQNNEVIAKGTVGLPDICSTSHDELEVTFQTAWQQQPPRDMEELALAARTSLASELRKSVQMWVQDFNKQY